MNQTTTPKLRTVQSYLDEVPPGLDGAAKVPMTSMQRLIFILASTGKLFEGLVIFMTGMALPLIIEDLNLTAAQAGLVTASSLGGILLGALFLGTLSDRLGRKAMFVAEMVIFTAFLVGFTFSTNLAWLLVCSVGMGLALGCDYPTAHLMLSETSSSRGRSRSVLGAFAFQAVGAVTGALVAVIVLSVATPSISSWRIMFGIAIIPAAVVTIGRLFSAKSPHWLLTKGRVPEAEHALARILYRGSGPLPEVHLAPLPPEATERARYTDLFRPDKSLRATILASVPWFLQDLSTYGIGIFTPVIIAVALGSTDGLPLGDDDVVHEVVHQSLVGAQGALIVDAFLIVGILVAIRYVNRLGSIFMQIAGFIGCAIGLALAAISDFVTIPALQTILVFIGFILFQFMTNAGPNAQTYLIAGEVFPTTLRGSGAGFAAACGKAGAVLTAFLFPMLLDSYGHPPVLFALVICSLLGALVTSRFRIDSTGKSLETLH